MFADGFVVFASVSQRLCAVYLVCGRCRRRRAFARRERRVFRPEVCSGIDLIAPVYLQNRTGTGRRDKTVLTVRRAHKHFAHKDSPRVWSRGSTPAQTTRLNRHNPSTAAATVTHTLPIVPLHCVPTNVFLQLHLYRRARRDYSTLCFLQFYQKM